MIAKLKAKLDMLKRLQKQMMCKMSEGEGDDEDEGEDALADLGDDKKIAEESEEADMDDMADEGGDETASSLKEFMRAKPKMPKGKGKVMMIAMMKKGGKKYG